MGANLPLGVSYMGTKRAIALPVREVIGKSRPGPFLDLFSGMCAIATAIAPSRPVWTNDCQHFAWNVAMAYFCSRELPPSRLLAASLCRPYYSKNITALTDRFGALIALESTALAKSSMRQLRHLED